MSILERLARFPRPGTLWLLLWGAAFCLGCGSAAPPPPQDPPDSSITVLASLYGEFAMRHEGRGPANEAEFHGFLKQLPEAQQKAMGVDDLESLFRSPRDQQTYVVIYGVAKVTPSVDTNGVFGKPIVVHERTGKDGSVYAANAFGAAEKIPSDELKQRLSAKRPAP